MSGRLSNRIEQIKPFATITVSNKAMELKAQGKDIVSLGFGEPDFDTPKHIRDAAIKAMVKLVDGEQVILSSAAGSKAQRHKAVARGVPRISQ